MNMINPNYEISILVIDDDAMVRSVMLDYLKEIGMTNVHEAKTPTEALKILQQSKMHFDLVLSDWEMPQVSGLTLLKAVRKNPYRKDLRFVLVTSQRSMERFKISQAAQWRVSAYIVKPFRQNLLRKKIWSVMGWGDEETLSA